MTATPFGDDVQPAGLPRRRRLVVGAAAAACAVALALTSCSTDPGEPTVKPSEAKQAIVERVEEWSTLLGGDWERYSGPAVRSCGQDDGAEGTAYVYIIERRDTDGTDPAADVATMKAAWDKAGIDTEEYQSGGDDPVLGIRGRGGPVTSIGFDAYPGRYSLTGVSQCSDGDPSVLRDEH